MNYRNKYVIVVLVHLFSLCCVSIKTLEVSTHPSEVHQGFIGEHKDEYFSCIRMIDALIEKYKLYYEVDEEKREIILTKELVPHDKKTLICAYKKLQEVSELFGSCSPGDYDYLEVKNVYYPLLREIGHTFHTYVMQPLGMRTLDIYDHTRKIMVPSLIVMGGVVLILLLQKCGLFPQCSQKTLIICALLIASAGIVYNYWSEIRSWKNNKGIDFATLARSGKESQERRILETVAHDVSGVLKRAASTSLK